MIQVTLYIYSFFKNINTNTNGNATANVNTNTSILVSLLIPELETGISIGENVLAGHRTG